jgi:hypothetical protein
MRAERKAGLRYRVPEGPALLFPYPALPPESYDACLELLARLAARIRFLWKRLRGPRRPRRAPAPVDLSGIPVPFRAIRPEIMVVYAKGTAGTRGGRCPWQAREAARIPFLKRIGKDRWSVDYVRRARCRG